MRLAVSATGLSVALAVAASIGIGIAHAQTPATPPAAHFHHVHINATDPDASIAFYTSRFNCEKAIGPGGHPAVRAQTSWILFNRVASQPPSELFSAIWHVGWGAVDMPAAYRKQLDAGTKFETPLIDIGPVVGKAKGTFFYAYVDGPNHELIELETFKNDHFKHLHLLSADPIAAAQWYHEHLGLVIANQQPEKRIYNGIQLSPAATVLADEVQIIIYPVEFARTKWPEIWQGRKDFEPTAGRVIDHIAFTREGAKPGFVEGPDHIRIELVDARNR
jgi:catechol 2,3-dioxygenase-like lactoylglutathione lyase family enzyme